MRDKGWMKAAVLAMGGILCFSLLGCGPHTAATKADDSTSNSSSSATEPSESPEPMSEKEAGEYYERLVESSNKVHDEFLKAYYDGDIVSLTESSESLAADYTEVAKKIELAAWPDKATKYAQKAASDFKKDAAAYEKLAGAASMEEFATIPIDVSDGSSTAALRKVLNLPAAPAAFQPFSSPGGEYTGIGLGSDYGHGRVTVKNDLGIVTYAVTPTVTFLDAEGNSLGETYPQSSTPVQPGASISVDFLVSPEITGKIKHIKVTSINWHRGSADSSDFFQAPVDGTLIDVK